MIELSFGSQVYGIRWGKYINGEMNILYEHYGPFDIALKEKIESLIDNRLYYFVQKEFFRTVDGYTTCTYQWIECEKEFLLEL
jgi:hypothetical protein